MSKAPCGMTEDKSDPVAHGCACKFNAETCAECEFYPAPSAIKRVFLAIWHTLFGVDSQSKERY